MKTWPNKDPDEVLDYGFDWTPRGIGTDTIADTTAVVEVGSVVVDSHTIDSDGKNTTTWLSGGTEGEKCSIVLRAMTAEGRHMDETLVIKIKTR